MEGGRGAGGGGGVVSMSVQRHGESHRPDLSLTRCTRPAEIGQVIVRTGGRGIDASQAKVG